MNDFSWGLLTGVSAAQIYDIVRAWRQAKAKINAVREKYGQPIEKRWWRL